MGPTAKPTDPPTDPPTTKPTDPPTAKPTDPPTDPPTVKPTDPPTAKPTDPPTVKPTDPPTAKPTELPTRPTSPPTTAIDEGNDEGEGGDEYEDGGEGEDGNEVPSHPCDDGSNTCAKAAAGGLCVKDGDGYVCQCSDGFQCVSGCKRSIESGTQSGGLSGLIPMRRLQEEEAHVCQQWQE